MAGNMAVPMRRSLKLLSVVVIVSAAALAYIWPYMQMEFAGSAHYTEQNKREYDFYTPRDSEKNSPYYPPL